MKGVYGLAVAIVLGIAAGLLNLFYLHSKSRDIAKVSYLGIKDGAIVTQGTRIAEEQLVPVDIPQRWIGNLDDFAIRYADLASVEGQAVSRTLYGGTLLLREHLETPRAELELAENERAMWIPVDSRAFVPSLLEPGDQVVFKIARSQLGAPTPAMAGHASDSRNTPVERIGPFTVLSLGNRLGSAEVMRAAKVPQTQENVLLIRVTPENEAKADKLWAILQATNYRSVGIELLSRERKTP